MDRNPIKSEGIVYDDFGEFVLPLSETADAKFEKSLQRAGVAGSRDGSPLSTVWLTPEQAARRDHIQTQVRVWRSSPAQSAPHSIDLGDGRSMPMREWIERSERRAYDALCVGAHPEEIARELDITVGDVKAVAARHSIAVPPSTHKIDEMDVYQRLRYGDSPSEIARDLHASVEEIRGIAARHQIITD